MIARHSNSEYTVAIKLKRDQCKKDVMSCLVLTSSNPFQNSRFCDKYRDVKQSFNVPQVLKLFCSWTHQSLVINQWTCQDRTMSSLSSPLYCKWKNIGFYDMQAADFEHSKVLRPFIQTDHRQFHFTFVICRWDTADLDSFSTGS